MDRNHKTQDFIWGALLGGAFGALTTMLFTTKKGKQIREEIADKYHDLEGKVKDLTEEAEETIESSAKKVAGKFKKEENKA